MSELSLHDVVARLKIGKSRGRPSIAKPILLMIALDRRKQQLPRLATFLEYDGRLTSLGRLSQAVNLIYPFNRLSTDGVWEVENEHLLAKNSSGDYSRRELIENNIRAGFSSEIYSYFNENPKALDLLARDFLLPKLPQSDQSILVNAFPRLNLNLKASWGHADWRVSDESQELEAMSDSAVTKHLKAAHTNSFVSYLNSLHNVGAAGANALAESQALSCYFAELYEPFPVVEDVINALTGKRECVVVLTGHAGDGKSTVALDILKRLRRLPPLEPLDQALKEREVIGNVGENGSQNVTIVKDMSELSADRRLEWLEDAFSSSGSWLIVSNTGPLLNSLEDFSRHRHVVGDIGSKILQQLNLEYVEGQLDDHRLIEFPKDLVIVNMTRLDNVTGGARLLTKMVDHSGWQSCEGCEIQDACPLLLNRNALAITGTVAEDRVRWIYRRLTAYEQRLTLRQMVAHLAYSITGGTTCSEAKKAIHNATGEGIEKGTKGLEEILFSEAFFGYHKGAPAQKAGRLRAVQLLRRAVFGGPVGPNFARELGEGQGSKWAILPKSLEPLSKILAERAGEAAGVRWRFAQRRLFYIFGSISHERTLQAEVFLDGFLQSARLRDYDSWIQNNDLSLSLGEKIRLKTACLNVLLETYSGFSSGQFRSEQDRLYLTLRRPDRAVVQSTQLVMATLSFRDFELRYDLARRIPLICFTGANICLALTLPLLDYIEARHAGDLGSELAQIHMAQLEWFRSRLLEANANQNELGEIQLLRAGIDGNVHIHRYVLDNDSQEVEILR